MPDLSSPVKAREHARAMGDAIVAAMPTIPASAAKNLPLGVSPQSVVWDEILAAGDYAARILNRGMRLRITNLEGDACIQFLAFNSDRPIERLNVADTVKVQWNAYLGTGKLLLSDMGRVLLSIVEDTCEKHDTFCGASNSKSNARKYGEGENYSRYPNARDRFLLALLKFGLAKKDIPPNINFFKHVRVESDGSLTFLQNLGKPGDYVELRAEANTLVVLANTPHVLDPRKQYTITPARVIAWRGPIAPPEDSVRNATPESLRAFQNTEDLYTQ